MFVAIVEVITLGFPAEDAASDRLSSRATRPRKALDEIVGWESWRVSVATIDLSAAAGGVADDVRRACEDVGFLTVLGHGVERG